MLGVEPDRIEPDLLCDMATDRVIDVTMKRIAAQVVALVSTVAAPRGPNAVCEPIPPKAAATSALLPLWIRTTNTRKRQTRT